MKFLIITFNYIPKYTVNMQKDIMISVTGYVNKWGRKDRSLQ